MPTLHVRKYVVLVERCCRELLEYISFVCSSCFLCSQLHVHERVNLHFSRSGPNATSAVIRSPYTAGNAAS